MANGNVSRTIRLNKKEEFHVIYTNPEGVRYYQDGRFFTCGGRYVPVHIPMNHLLPRVREQIKKDGGLKPIVEVEQVATPPVDDKPFKCPHCDKSYKDKDWYDKHLATHEIDE